MSVMTALVSWLRVSLRRRRLCILFGGILSFLLIVIWTVGLPSSSVHQVRIPSNEILPSFQEPSRLPKPKQGELGSHKLPDGSRIELPGAGRESSGDCEGLKSPESALIDQFQPIEKDSQVNAVFSAYFDNKGNGGTVRVVGIMEPEKVVNLYCQLWFLSHGNVIVSVVTATARTLPSTQMPSGKPVSVMLDCEVEDKKLSPFLVSIVRNKRCQQPVNSLRVQTLLTRRPELPSFALCVSPALHSTSGGVARLLQYAILYRLLGVERLFLYNANMPINMLRAARALEAEGLALLVPWMAPSSDDELALRHDCLLRATGFYRTLIFAGLDNVLMPRREKSWLKIFQRFAFHLDVPAVVRLHRVHFLTDQEQNSDPEAVDVQTDFVLRLQRLRRMEGPSSHSSYMVDPLQVSLLGLHDVAIFNSPGAQKQEIHPGDALVHNYAEKQKVEGPTMTDKNMLRFRDELVDRVRALWMKYARVLRRDE